MSNDEKKFPAVKTTITTRSLVAALRQAWPSGPQAAIELLAAHSAYETGWWRECFNWNLGNAKAGEDEPHCYRECGEELTPADAEAERVVFPSLVRIVGPSKRAGLVSVDFAPEHPITRFAAFETLVTGIQAHLDMLRADFPGAWLTLQTGDANAYCEDLHDAGYYTASQAGYAAGVAGCLAMVRDELWSWQDPTERLVDVFTRCAGWHLPGDHEKLAWLVGRGVDDDAWARQIALLETNCATSLLGAIGRACLTDEGRKACHPLVARRSEVGMSLSWVVQIMREKGLRIGVPTEPALLWYGTPGHNDDHVALQTGPWAGAATTVCEGGGGANRINVGARDTTRSWGRPLRGWLPVAALGLPAARTEAYDGATLALQAALDAGRVASGAIWSAAASERPTLPDVEE